MVHMLTKGSTLWDVLKLYVKVRKCTEDFTKVKGGGGGGGHPKVPIGVVTFKSFSRKWARINWFF